MRLKAKTYLTYAGKEWAPGQLFDAPKTRALVMIDRGDAEPFLLEDPSQRTLEDAIDNLLPAEPPPPSPPAEVSLSPDVAPALAGGGTGAAYMVVSDPRAGELGGDRRPGSTVAHLHSNGAAVGFRRRSP